MLRVLLAIATSLVICATTVLAQENDKPLSRKRVVYSVQHLPATDLSKVLTQLVSRDEDLGDVRIIPESISNSMLISAEDDAVDVVIALLESLDRPTPMITIDVVIVEVKATKHGADEIVLPDLSGAVEDVAKKIDELSKKGELDIVDRIRLSAVAGQKAFVQTGATTPVVRSVMAARGGFPGQANSITDVSTGMIVQVTPRVSPDGTVVLDINFEKSAIAEGPILAEGPDGQAVRGSKTVTTTAQSTLTIPSGGVRELGNLTTKSSNEAAQSLILVSAQVQRSK